MSSLDTLEVNVSSVVKLLRIRGDFSSALQDVIKRKAMVRAARENGFTVTDDELQNAADTFRRSLGLEGAAETEEWLESNGLTLDDFEDHIEENVLIKKWKNQLYEDTDIEELIEEDDDLRQIIREKLSEEWVSTELF